MSTAENMYIINLDSGIESASPKISQFTNNAQCIKFITGKNLTDFSLILLSSIENVVSVIPEGEKLAKTFNAESAETEILWYPDGGVTAQSGPVVYQLAAFNVQSNDEAWYSPEGRLIVNDSIDSTNYSANLLGSEPNLLMQILNMVKALELDMEQLDVRKVDKVEGKNLSQNDFTNQCKENLEKATTDIEKLFRDMPVTDETYSSQSINPQSGKAVAEAVSELIDSAPDDLNTLRKLAVAIGGNPNFADYVLADINSIRANIDGAAQAINDAKKALDGKVDKELGKGLSTIDFTNNYKVQIEDNTYLIGDTNKLFTYTTENLVDAINEIYNDVHQEPLTQITSTLIANKEYYLGKVKDVFLSFPLAANNGDAIYLNFETGIDGATLGVDITNTTTEFDLVPSYEKGYEIYAKYNGRVWILSYSEYDAPIEDSIPDGTPEIPDIEFEG